MPANEAVVGRYLRWFLAVVAAACALVHFAAAGDHFDVGWAHGGFFAAAGWLQLVWAVALVARPEERRLLSAGVVLHGGIVVVWAVSRTVGVPFGDGAGAEAVGFADALVTAFEVVLVLASLAVLRRPALAEQPVQPAIARSAVTAGAAAIMAVSTTAVTPSFASEHGHGGGGDGHAGHGIGVIAADGTSECERAGVETPSNSANGGHGHRGPVPWQPLDRETRALLAEQLAAAQAVVERYPTVADAEAAGYRQGTVYLPCIAAHYVLEGNDLLAPFDPGKPDMILFAGTEPDSEVVGLSYGVISEEEPEGFAGPNDVWHVHEQVCMKDGLILGSEKASPEECEARGGVMADTANGWMAHLWNVPQWENRWGLFASEHPDLGGRLGDIDAPPDPEADDGFFE